MSIEQLFENMYTPIQNSDIMTTLDMLFFPYLFPLLGILGKLGKSVITINDFVALHKLYGGGLVVV